jgi:hypothetical protein
MKTNKLITAALLSLGLISSASASGTFGNTNVVYITGSTAFRPNLFAALTTVPASGTTVFDNGTTVSAVVAGGGAASNGSSVYNVTGVIGGQPYIISVSLTGSEAGLAALQGSTITYSVPANAEMTGGPTATKTVTLPGTPQPTFLAPGANTATVVAAPDLSLADTSFAVSLSSGGTFTDYGIVGVIPFLWAKGVNSTTDSSWSDLVNVSQPQLLNMLTTAPKASIFTGAAADTDKVYLIGRNKGSGTRVNMECDLFATIANSITQYAPNNSSYAGGNTLTVGTVTPFTVNSIAKNSTGVHLASVGNDGFDSGSGVKSTLNYDISGLGFITLGYLGLSDAGGLTHPSLATPTGNGQWLSLDGVPENDGNVITGAYSFWGHEHFYGAATLSTAASTVGTLLGGTTANQQLIGFSSNGALEANGVAGGTVATANSTAIDAALMHADKPSGGDVGYPSPF